MQKKQKPENQRSRKRSREKYRFSRKNRDRQSRKKIIRRNPRLIPLPKEKTADGKLDSYVGKKIKMGIRPEDIDDEPEFMAKHTDCQLDAKVDVSEMMGAEIYLYLEYKGNKMTARVAPTSKARNGDTVRVAFDPHKVHLFDIETEQTILN